MEPWHYGTSKQRPPLSSLPNHFRSTTTDALTFCSCTQCCSEPGCLRVEHALTGGGGGGGTYCIGGWESDVVLVETLEVDDAEGEGLHGGHRGHYVALEEAGVLQVQAALLPVGVQPAHPQWRFTTIRG